MMVENFFRQSVIAFCRNTAYLYLRPSEHRLKLIGQCIVGAEEVGQKYAEGFLAGEFEFDLPQLFAAVVRKVNDERNAYNTRRNSHTSDETTEEKKKPDQQ
jgi:hypothetical protein